MNWQDVPDRQDELENDRREWEEIHNMDLLSDEEKSDWMDQSYEEYREWAEQQKFDAEEQKHQKLLEWEQEYIKFVDSQQLKWGETVDLYSIEGVTADIFEFVKKRFLETV
jgi:hypothetical protein